MISPQHSHGPARPLIRPARPADCAAIAEIFAGYVTGTVITFQLTPPAPAYWEDRLGELTAAGLPFLVAEDAGRVAGYAYLSPWRPQPAYRHTAEDTVYLRPDQTGRGLGRRLLTELLSQGAAAGIRQVIAVIADTGDPASTALHTSLGFVPAGRLHRVGRKHDRWIDTTLLQCDLAPGRGSLE